MLAKLQNLVRAVRSFLSGKKTYITAAGMAVYAVFVLGVDEGDWNAAWEQLLEAGAVAGLRAGYAGFSKN